VPQLGRNAIVQLIAAYNEVVQTKFSANSFWVNTTISLDKVSNLCALAFYRDQENQTI
jgi:hypothetical protein